MEERKIANTFQFNFYLTKNKYQDLVTASIMYL